MLRTAVLLLILVLPLASAQAAGPLPPCGSPTVPAYGPIDGPPAAGAWHATDLRRERWLPPSCLGWQGDSRLVVALASRFHSPMSLDALAERLTAVSGHASIKFWSITRQEWRPLVLESSIVDGPDAKAQLPDPPRGALVSGGDFYYAEEPEVGGRAVYRLRVRERTANRLVLTSENVAPIRVAIITLFDPGALQVATFLDREGPDLWALYEITRASADSSSMVVGYQSSYLNRLEAMRRHLVGLPTDRDPPIAPW